MADAQKIFDPNPHSSAANLVYHLEQATRSAVILQYMGVRSGGASVRHSFCTDSMQQALTALTELNEFIKQAEKEYADHG